MAVVVKEKEEFSFIEDEGKIGFIDYEDDRSVCNYNLEDEGPVKISIPFPQVGNRPQSVNVGETYSHKITLTNTSTESLELWKIDIYDSSPKNSFTLSLMEPPSETSDPEYVQRFRELYSLEDRVLQQGKTLNVWLSCKPKDIGLHTTAVQFDVEGDKIERLVFLLAEDKVSHLLTSNKPFRKDKKPRNGDLYHLKNYVPGVPPPRTSNRSFKNKLPMFPIPKNMRELLKAEQMPDSIRIGLSKDNYSPFFSALMIMEEIKLEEIMRAYDMQNISFRKKGHLLTLEVPGLAERRPSLVYGDFILVKHKDANVVTTPYQGHIHRIEAEEVFLRFGDEFYRHHAPGNLYNVQFNYNRANMRRSYQAVKAAESLGIDFLFPSESEQMRVIRPVHVPSLSLALNEEQKVSVQTILGCRGGSPYVIYGPPGTGKTVTLVEAIFQLYTQQRNIRILVCAPSNSAADHLLEVLLSLKGSQLNLDDIFRMNAIARPFEDVNPDILEFCIHEDGVFKCPTLRSLQSFRIIICTYMSSCLLHAEGVQRGHFSHIFLDEAGQASEPETMVPLSNLCLRRTVVVLAGDPKQLGPVIHSKEAEELGMGMSFLERLFDECVHYEGGNRNYVTELVQNYRSHPDILHLPSEIFYNGQLIACKRNTGFSTTGLDFLPNKEFPILYIGIQGSDEREGTNPSWFNRFEASKVVEIIRILKDKNVVKAEDIGVITPYRQQVLKINKALESFDCSDVKVGSVEQFQGQEKEVIIISTVRSTIRHNEFDRTFCLGFLSNPKRFNVAITRAKSLMIVIGNPHITSKDPYWNTLLWYCVDAGSYIGCNLPEREQTILENRKLVEDVDYEEKQEGSESGEESSHLGNRFPEMDNLMKALPAVVEPSPPPPPVCDPVTRPAVVEPPPPSGSDYGFNIPKPIYNEDEWEDGWKV
ncbi:probable RNA helicase SDE3 [Impatiens glandulifera]|uniref:probable RNA helicase SDE3 n=1 Tax=Impatiens glandulifera TaxID=253017 RepID=UPI001FB19938|nr:probable RNA helicase SDE3 [Impatiens glandulifera]XP_047317362.1 probable RNA helicase SDE3 [Impatiens glandulifera]